MIKQKQMTPVVLTENEMQLLSQYASNTFMKIFGEFIETTDYGDFRYRLSYDQIAEVYGTLAFLEDEGYSA